MGHQRQLSLSRLSPNWRHRFCHGGSSRNHRKGRGQRPLSTREPLHAVSKSKRKPCFQKSRSPRNFAQVQKIISKYARKFFVKVEQLSIQNDHVHLLLRTSRRSHYHFFFRVVTGQISQSFGREGRVKPYVVTDTPIDQNRPLNTGRKLWKFRPFTRVVRGWRAYKTLRNYIQLNEMEAKGKIKYWKLRLKALSKEEWKYLWSVSDPPFYS